MQLSPAARKLVLTAHVAASVGWFGAVGVFLALAIIGLTSDDPIATRGVYLVMEHAARMVLLPLAVASLITGVLQSVGSAWGLFRHYWVLFKLLLTVVATVILIVYMQTFTAMAGVAADPGAALAHVRNPSPVLHSVLALALLAVTTVLSVYKPRGLTPWGWKRLAASEGTLAPPMRAHVEDP